MDHPAATEPAAADQASDVTHTAPAIPPRKKYVFKKRDPAEAAKLEAERLANMKQNPFGDAKPREAVLAARTGKDEATVLKEDASTYDIHLKLTSTQFAEKMARQREIDDLKAVLATGDGDQGPEELQADIIKKEADLADLVKGFEDMLVEQAKAGQGARVDRTKTFDHDIQDSTDDYSSFSSGAKDGMQSMRSNRGSFQPGAYEDTGGREPRKDAFGGGPGGSRDGGMGKGRRGGRREGGWGGSRDGFGDGFNSHHGKGQGHMRSAQGADGAGLREDSQGGSHAGGAHSMGGMGYNYAAPPLNAGYTMPASESDYLPVHER